MALTVGDVIGFSAEVRDPVTLVLANAGTMTVAITLPDGTAAPSSPFTISPTTTGVYDKNITSTMAGRYVAKWVATGANAGAHTQVVHVRSGDETALVSLDEVKDHLNIPLATTTHDQELERKMGAATGVVEFFCGPVIRRTKTNEIQGGYPDLALHHDQVLELTSVTPILTGSATVTVADLDTSISGIVRHTAGLPISSGPLRVVYVVGREDIPDELIEAALIIVKHLWETQRGPIPSGLLGAGETTFLPAFGFAIPNRAVDLMKMHPTSAIGVA